MTEYSYLTFDSKGRLDAVEREKAARLAMDTLEQILPDKNSERIIDAKHSSAKKDSMIDICGNQRLRLRRLFRGQFSAESMRTELLD